MNKNTTLRLAVLGLVGALVGTAAYADSDRPSYGPQAGARTRDDVRAETRQAQARGLLVPAGQGPTLAQPVSGSPTGRDAVQGELAVARATGGLIPAGEGPGAALDKQAQTRGSLLARSDVKAEVLRARRAGELVPAGEGPIDEVIAQRHPVGSTARSLFAFRGQNRNASN
jgi:Domain of unknown function (DUF4148)